MEHIGWAIKYSWGYLDAESFRYNKTDVVKDWNKQSQNHPSLIWKNARRRCGHRLVKVRLTEIGE